MIGSHDFTNAAALHDLTNGDALCVVGRRAHAATHIGIDGKPFGFDQDLTRPRIGYRLLPRSSFRESAYLLGIPREAIGGS